MSLEVMNMISNNKDGELFLIKGRNKSKILIPGILI